MTKQLDKNFLTSSIQVDGAPDTLVTHSMASLSMQFDDAGLVVSAPQNVSDSSEDRTGHSSASGTLANDPSGITHPDGLDVFEWVEDSGTSTHTARLFSSGFSTNGGAFSLDIKPINETASEQDCRVELKGVNNSRIEFTLSGAGSIDVTGSNVVTGSGSIAKLEGGWYRIGFAINNTIVWDGTSDIRPFMNGAASYAGTGSDGYYFSRYRVFKFPAQSDYIFTDNSTPVYGARLERDSAGARIGVRIESAATNICLWSDDLTDVAWVKTTMTAALTETGIGGVVNTASKLTATAGNATALQTVTNASSEKIFSAFVKRLTGSGTINMTQDNGVTWADVTAAVDAGAGFVRVKIVAAVVTNPILGFRLVTNGDEIAVEVCQEEENDRPTTPIRTEGTGITRAAESALVPTSAFTFDPVVGTLAVAAIPDFAPTAEMLLARLDDGTANEVIGIVADSSANIDLDVIDGGVSQAALDSGVNAVADVSVHVAARYEVNNFGVSTDGLAAVVDILGTLPTVTTLDFGDNNVISRLRYYDEALEDFDLAVVSGGGEPHIQPQRVVPAGTRREIDRQESSEHFLLFLTVTHPSLSTPIRVVSDPVDFVLGGVTFTGYVFHITILTDDDGAPFARLTIQNIDSSIGEVLRSIVEPPVLKLEIIAASEFDLTVDPRTETATAARTYSGDSLVLSGVDVDVMFVTGRLQARDFAREMWPGLMATEDRFPGLFR